MTATLLVQVLVNGLQRGMIFVLVASGLVLILGVAKIFNFAHGEFYMLGAYAAFFACCIAGLNYALGLILAVLAIALLGGLTYTAVFRHIRSNILLGAAATMGLSLIFRQGALVLFGSLQKGIPSVFPGLITVAGISLKVERLVIIMLALLVMLVLYLILMKTRLGKSIRAVMADEEAASLQGIDSNVIYLITVAIGCSLAGFAGATMAPVYAIFPDMGVSMLMIVLLVIIVGGLESLNGAVITGLAVGLLLSFGYQFIGVYNEIVVFLIVAAFLLFRPWGLFGHPHEAGW